MGWKINGVPHTGQIITVGPSGRDFTNPRDAFNAASSGALVLLDPGTYPSATKDSANHIYEWNTKKIYWRGLGDAPSDTVLDVNTFISGLMISARDMLFENLQFNPTSYGLLRYAYPITTGLILNKCKITNDREQCQYSVVNGWADQAQIIDGGIKFINVDFPDTQAGVFCGAASNYQASLSKIYVSKCIIPDNDPNGYYLTGTYALLDYVTSPTEGYGSNYGAYLITEEYDGSFTTESAVASATMDGITPIESTTESAEATDTFDGYSLRDSFTESAEATDTFDGYSLSISTTESAEATDTFDGYSLSSSTTESAEATDTFGNERTSYGPTTESAEVTDSMDALHLVDSITESAVVSGSMEAAEIIRKRIRFPNLQGKHLSLKFTSATDGSFAIYYLRHKMFKTRELCSDQKHPNTQGSHIGVKLSNSGSDAFTLMYVSQEMQLVTT